MILCGQQIPNSQHDKVLMQNGITVHPHFFIPERKFGRLGEIERVKPKAINISSRAFGDKYPYTS